MQVGDYWVIYLLSKNLNPIAMKELLEELKPVQNLSLHQCKTFHKILLWYKTLLDLSSKVMAPASNSYQPAYPSMEMDEKESNM